MYEDNHTHPLPGFVANPEWQVALTKRAELYLAERARRQAPDHEPSRFAIALAILGCIGVAVSLLSAVML
jgi:hypothetical protein